MSATKVTKACTKGCHNYRTFKQFNLLQRTHQLTEHVTISRCPLHNGWTRRSESVSHLSRFTCAVPLAFSLSHQLRSIKHVRRMSTKASHVSQVCDFALAILGTAPVRVSDMPGLSAHQLRPCINSNPAVYCKVTYPIMLSGGWRCCHAVKHQQLEGRSFPESEFLPVVHQ